MGLLAPLVLFGAILGVDYITKAWVECIALQDPLALPYVLFSDILGISFQITHASNTGAAWGIFANFPHALVVLRLVLIASLVIYLACYNTKKEWQMPLILIVSGAFGNVIDFFIYGYVIDMIQINLWGYDYPVFNIADSSICIGSLWLLVLSFFDTTKSHDTTATD